MKVLVVDDDRDLRELVAYALRQAGYLALEASDGVEALATCARELPDLVILDVNMPGLNGFEVCRRIRAEAEAGGAGVRGPHILMLTVRAAEEDEVRGLDLGADDYLTKPFRPRTLLARVRALTRRATGGEAPAPLRAGDLALDAEAQTVAVRGGKPVRLTNLEFRLFQLLMANAGRPVAWERVASHVWGDRGVAGDRQLAKQLVHRLRQKVESDPADPRYIATVTGTGYLVRPAGGPPGPIGG